MKSQSNWASVHAGPSWSRSAIAPVSYELSGFCCRCFWRRCGSGCSGANLAIPMIHRSEINRVRLDSCHPRSAVRGTVVTCTIGLWRVDQRHDAHGNWRLGNNGKEPDVQLCVQADAGIGSSFDLAVRPARLNTALEFTRLTVAELVKREKARREFSWELRDRVA